MPRCFMTHEWKKENKIKEYNNLLNKDMKSWNVSRCFKREIEKTKVVQVIHLFFFKKTKL